MSIDKKQIIGQTIRRLRKERGLTQEALGLAIGQDSGTISKFERGLINFTMDTLLKLAEQLDTSPAELVKGTYSFGPSLICYTPYPEQRFDPDIGNYLIFGLKVYYTLSGPERHSHQVGDISVNFAFVQKLANFMTILEISPTHMPDVVEDFCSSDYCF